MAVSTAHSDVQDESSALGPGDADHHAVIPVLFFRREDGVSMVNLSFEDGGFTGPAGSLAAR